MPSIAIMNAKGGVGKSTLTAALAETLSYSFGKSVLVIDADGQMSVSLMLVPVNELNGMRTNGQTLVGMLVEAVLSEQPVDIANFVKLSVSDVDDANNIHLLAGDMGLPLLERAISESNKSLNCLNVCTDMLSSCASAVDYVLVDCAPGISIMTEIFLRTCDYHIVPVKPDVLAMSGMQYLKAFRSRDPDLRFAQHLGTIINMNQRESHSAQIVVEKIRAEPENKCFSAEVPLIPLLQKTSLFSADTRSYQGKYPTPIGVPLRQIAAEIIEQSAQHP